MTGQPDNFLSAEKLGLEEHQRSALIETLKLFEAGKIHHVTAEELMMLQNGVLVEGRIGTEDQPKLTHDFNMQLWVQQYGCRTVSCIGGTAELVGRLAPEELGEIFDENLEDLVYPRCHDMRIITSEQATVALRNYLSEGRAMWSEILGDNYEEDEDDDSDEW